MPLLPATDRVAHFHACNPRVRDLPLETDGFASGPCHRTSALVFAGHGRTDEVGRWVLDLNRTQGLEVNLALRPASVVATPVLEGDSGIPKIPVAVSRTLGPGRIEVRTFDLQGQPLGGVLFSWQCVVEKADG